MAHIHLTERAIQDILDIEDWTKEQWGQKQADRYLQQLQETLILISENPGLLKTNPNISSYFKIYRMQLHWLICQTANDNVYILTLRHASQDLLARLKKLEPSLEEELKILSNHVHKNETSS